MPHLTGPEFIALQAEDLSAARAFYGGLLGLEIREERPDAVVFDTAPIPFAVRLPLVDLAQASALGQGVALWFGCDDADALHGHLSEAGTEILAAPKEGPFGRFFSFRDPFGYVLIACAK